MSTQPKRPVKGWRCIGQLPKVGGAFAWQSEGDLAVGVISAVEIVEDKDSPIAKPSYHVSAIAYCGPHLLTRRSCTDAELDEVRDAFQMDGADEDNHGEGIARHLWLVVGKRVEDPCACKQDEETQTDGPREFRA